MISILLILVSLDINPPDVEQEIKAGLEYAYVEQFDSARFHFDGIVRDHPQNPAGYFMNAALLQLKMMDECRFELEDEYFKMMRKAIACAEEILTTEDNSWARFYLASAYTYQAVYKGFRKDYFETFKLGVKGGKMMQDLVRDDSSFYDAYLASGTYEYFWARASRYIPFLNIGGGDVDGAIRKLHVAAEKSRYSGPTARNSLVFVYSEEGYYDKADSIIDGLRAEYPGSKTFLWNEADLEYRKKNYQVAAVLYDDLYNRYDSSSVKNYANLAQCRLSMGKCYTELGDKDRARKYLKEVIRLNEHAKEYPQIKTYYREAYALLNRLL